MKMHHEGSNIALIFVSVWPCVCARCNVYSALPGVQASPSSVVTPAFIVDVQSNLQPDFQGNQLRSPQNYYQCLIGGADSNRLSCRLPRRNGQTLLWSTSNLPFAPVWPPPSPRSLRCWASNGSTVAPRLNVQICHRSQRPSTTKDEWYGCLAFRFRYGIPAPYASSCVPPPRPSPFKLPLLHQRSCR